MPFLSYVKPPRPHFSRTKKDEEKEVFEFMKELRV